MHATHRTTSPASRARRSGRRRRDVRLLGPVARPARRRRTRRPPTCRRRASTSPTSSRPTDQRLRADGGRCTRSTRARRARSSTRSDPRLRRRAAPGRRRSPSPPARGTVLTEIDIGNPAAMRVLRTLSVDGELVSARLHPPARASPRQPRASTSRPAARPVPRAAAAKPLRARRAGWVPDGAAQPPQGAAQPRARRLRRRPAHAALHRRRHGDRAHDRPPARAAGGRLRRVMTERGHRLRLADEPLRRHQRRLAARHTSIHRFDLAGAPSTDYRASGQVPGDLLNQFSLSEHEGVLRAATTEGSRRRARATSPLLEPAAVSSRGSGRSAGSAAASASTPCASSATAATS